MRVLVLGASGATGKLVVQGLLAQNKADRNKNLKIKAVYRESANIPDNLSDNKNVEIIKGNISEFSSEEILKLIKDCDSVVCCLGHNISFRGIFGPPYMLVGDTVKNIVKAIHRTVKVKFILMSTTAYTNKKDGERNSVGEGIVFSLLKVLLPPHRDNMIAADHLVQYIGKNPDVEWIAIRPDSLFDEMQKSEYELLERKRCSPIFNPGKTSRINVSCFITELLTNDILWNKWKHKTPVIYNKSF